MSKLFKIFQNSFVYILTRTLRSYEKVGSNSMSGPVVTKGFLIDEDEDYWFLGITPDEITDAVKKDDTVRVFLPVEELEQMLGMTSPANEEEMN